MRLSKFISLSLMATLVFYQFFVIFPANGSESRRSQQDQIDAYIGEWMRAANIPGLALGVVKDGQIVYLKGYGVAGPDGRAVTPQTPLILGSTSKSFTALAVMQLVEAGKIDLDAPVTTYLPWFRTADPAASSQITVRSLLNQTSGLPVYEGRRGFGDDDRSDLALENGVRALAGIQLRRPAGQAFEYANENYTILGQIIQAVSGHSYEDYIRANIFVPLQMSHSAAALSDAAASDMAVGYRYWLWWPVAFEAPYPRRMTPAGFLISSAEDMSHYLIAQLNGGVYDSTRVLSPQGVAELHAAGAKMTASSSYGMGWVVHDQPGGIKLEHTGDTSNFHSNMLLLPDQQLGIVILTNVNGFNHGSAINTPIEDVADILLGHELTAPQDSSVDWVAPALPIVPLLIVAGWIGGSYFFMRHWQSRGELPLRAWQRVWRYGLPLGVDLSLAGAAWIIIPVRFQTPLDAISLFAPDIFLSMVLITTLSLGWAIARTFLVFRGPHPFKWVDPVLQPVRS